MTIDVLSSLIGKAVRIIGLLKMCVSSYKI